MTTIVIISHSEDIANGTKVLLNQMVNGVKIVSHGGTQGGIGTSFDDVSQVIQSLEEDALCFYDIGSAEMNLEMAIDMYDGPHRVVKVDAPIVEGSFVAAVDASVGQSIDDILKDIATRF